MILGVKGLTLSIQKCKWTPAKDRERNRDRKLGKVKGGGEGGRATCWSGISSLVGGE